MNKVNKFCRVLRDFNMNLLVFGKVQLISAVHNKATHLLEGKKDDGYMIAKGTIVQIIEDTNVSDMMFTFYIPSIKMCYMDLIKDPYDDKYEILLQYPYCSRLWNDLNENPQQ